ncbi:MFS transporter [Wohlfahrtiimonas chitiniclastica]|uniref:MFS transporter n=1 Tax=Wohlfahrtiimonas chitiniclastica TaxID=400946 RepID=UPI000379306A|nr:MFS transporter [Wohlfahrtiimonas chitiniclastica]
MESHHDDRLKQQVIKKAFIRLMPVLLFAYVLAYLDRVNISFAGLTMMEDLGLSAKLFGYGTGIFFIGYFLFEVPSNLLLTKFGARRWISRIMITWGLVSACMAFAAGDVSFLIMRFLLGAAEAGFFPGIILYLTFWFPQEYRARIISVFMLSIPLSLAVGAPLSTALLGLNGIGGLHGWQWLFIIEGIPTVLVGLLFLFAMPDRPKDAKWLSSEEKTYLQGVLDAESASIAKKAGTHFSLALKHPIVWILAIIYISNVTANIGLSSFLPRIIKEQGTFTNMQIGWITSIPYFVGVLGSLAFGFLTDKFKAPFLLLLLAILLTGVGLVTAGYLYAQTAVAMAIIAVSVAGIGIYGFKAPFWSLPSMFLTGAAAATGIAMINSIGNLGGFIGPSVIGWVRDATGSYAAGLYFLGGLSIFASLLSMFLMAKYAKSSDA